MKKFKSRIFCRQNLLSRTRFAIAHACCSLAMQFGSVRKLCRAPTLSAAYFATDAFANVRREIAREVRQPYHLHVRHHLRENATYARTHTVSIVIIIRHFLRAVSRALWHFDISNGSRWKTGDYNLFYVSMMQLHLLDQFGRWWWKLR